MSALTLLANTIKNMHNGQLYYAGGYVRDVILNRQPSDIDLIATGISLDDISNSLVNIGIRPKIGNEKNKAFVGFMLDGVRHEISVSDEELRSDSYSRDLTMNAMYMDVLTNQLHDFWGGEEDIKNQVLRAPSAAFKRDPRRVLRVWSSISRFGFAPDMTLLRYCHQLYEQRDQVSDEVWGTEFMKVVGGKHTTLAMNFLAQSNWIKQTPFWSEQIDFDQQNPHHEESLWEHTLMVTQQATHYQPKFVAAALFHDTGKLTTKHIKENGYANYHGHDEVSAMIADETMKKWGIEHKFVDEVVELIREHMSLYDEVNDRTLRRLSSRMKFNTLNDVLVHAICDKKGRIPQSNMDDKAKVVAKFIENESNKFIPVLQGRDILQLGIEPGEEIGKILKAAQQAQIDGVFSTHEDGIRWLHHYLERPGKRNRVRVYLDLTHSEVEAILARNNVPVTQENVAILKANIRFLVTKHFNPEFIKSLYE